MEEPEGTSQFDSQGLVAAAQDGDSTALDRLMSAHLPLLRAYVRMHGGADLRAREACSDIVQSVCRQVLVDLPQFDYIGEGAFRRWLYVRAQRNILDKMRYWGREKRDTRREHGLGETSAAAADDALAAGYSVFVSPSQGAMNAEAVSRLESAIDELGEDQRTILSMRTILCMSLDDIAHELDVEHETAKKRLARARAALWKGYRGI